MKAAFFEGVKSIRLMERPKPLAGPGEVVVKIKYCGICGTDVDAYLHEGQWPSGIVLGHESVGTIEEIGAGVTGWKRGERVAVRPSGICGECFYCRQGLHNLCIHAFEITLGLSPGVDGGFAEYVLIRYPKDMLYRLPDSVTFEDAVLLDPLGVALGGLRKSKFRMGDNVVVVGAGSVGLSMVIFLKMAGARHISVVSRSASRRYNALEHGAHQAFDPHEEGPGLRQKIMELYRGIGADVVFECSGAREGMRTAIDLVRKGGQVMLLGSSESEIPAREMDLIVREVELKASLTYNEEFGLIIDLLSQGRIDTKSMLSDIIKLDDIVTEGFNRLVVPNELYRIVVAP